MKMNHPYLPLWSLLFTSANHAELKHTHWSKSESTAERWPPQPLALSVYS